MYPIVQLKKGKEAAVGHGHPWVFSGAIDKAEESLVSGDIVKVLDSSGATLGVGAYSDASAIAVRLMARGEATIDTAWFTKTISAADARRRVAGLGRGNDEAYRVVFGEADGLPGLVVDRYADVAVIQLSIPATDRMRADIAKAVVAALGVSTVIERSDLPSRADEGLQPKTGVLVGEAADDVAFTEAGMRFTAQPTSGQKTGFYLDQRDLRAAIMRHADGKDVLNLFSYSGASAIAAMKGGAVSALNVDASADALAACVRHAEANGVPAEAFRTEEADVFQWLGDSGEGEYGMVIIDPPALIKSKKDAESGKKAYHFLNRAAMRLVRDGGIFVTSSCSRHMNREDLEFTLRRASVQAGIRLHVLASLGQPSDHPLSIYFPESAYLKSFVFLVERVA